MISFSFIENRQSSQLNLTLLLVSAIAGFGYYGFGANSPGIDIFNQAMGLNPQPRALTTSLHLAFMANMAAIMLWRNNHNHNQHQTLMNWARQGLSMSFGAILGWGIYSLSEDYSHKHLLVAIAAYCMLLLTFYVAPNMLFKFRMQHIAQTAQAQHMVMAICTGFIILAGYDMVSGLLPPSA